MLLDEDPASLINHTINNFNTAPDKALIGRVQDALSSLKESRELRTRAAETGLKKLGRNLAALQSAHAELTSQHSSAAHASEIARLDTQKFRVAKAASDLEMEAERLSGQHADLAARLAELEAQGVEGAPEDAAHRRDPVDEEVLLRLRVYRSLGIEPQRDEADGEFHRAIVRNDRKQDMQIINVDKKMSRFFYANFFWSTL